VVKRIQELKKKLNAVILVHNYQIGEVQEAGDFVGDSLELSQKAARVKEEVIVFCGVRFMAETAAILSPDKTVLIPDSSAGCPMADMITAPELRQWKKNYPGRSVVCYVVVEVAEGDGVLFVPDKNLAAYVARKSKKKIIPWDGYCYVHNNIFPEHVQESKKKYPDAEFWVHPESRPEVIDIADKVLSTGGMIREARTVRKKNIIVGTEAGMVYRLQKENPGHNFYPVKETALCSNMKKITLRKVLDALEEKKYRVEVPREIADRARGAIEKMVKLS